MLDRIEKNKGGVKRPGELDIQIRFYYGRWAASPTAAVEEMSFSRTYDIAGRYLWDDGDRS